MPSRRSWTDPFPENFQWSNATLVCRGMAPYGAVALADIDVVVGELESSDGSAGAFQAAWGRAGVRAMGLADEAEARGAVSTAGMYRLRAGNYFYTGERFVPLGEEKRRLCEEAFAAYHAGLALAFPAVEFLELDANGVSLPALFMPACGVDGPAPTVVIFNGMDNCKEMSVLFAGLEFAARGINTLAVDGPGQGESLRLRGIHARPDYEVPAAAAYELLCGRSDVDPMRIVAMGYSFGGCYAARIAAREPRFAGAVAMTSGHWDLAAFQKGLMEKAELEGRSVAQSTFQFRWVMGAADADEALAKAQDYGTGNVAAEIDMPFLVTHGGSDRIVPVANAHRLFEAIPETTAKTLRVVPSGEPGCEHAHVDDRQAGVSIAADWIAETLSYERGTRRL